MTIWVQGGNLILDHIGAQMLTRYLCSNVAELFEYNSLEMRLSGRLFYICTHLKLIQNDGFIFINTNALLGMHFHRVA